MAWYNSNFKDRYPVAINVLGGPESAGNEDVQIVVPKDWDSFWSSIRPDGFDVVLTDSEGNQLNFQRVGYNYANRVLTLEADNVNFQNRNSIPLLYIYYNYPSQSSDLASSFTVSSPKIGTIALNRPSSYAVGNLNVAQGTNSPLASFQKAVDEEIYIWFRYASLLTQRITPYNNKLNYEEIGYVKVSSLDAAGSDDIARYSEADTRYIPGWIGAKFKAGSAGTNYTVAIEIVTTCTGFTQKYSARALLSINNLLP